MKNISLFIPLFFLFFISRSQTFSLLDSIRLYDSLEQTNKAILLAHKTLNNATDKNSLEAAWIYYYNGVKFLMYHSIGGNIDKVDSIKFFAEKSLKIIENKYPKDILLCKNYFLLGGYNMIQQNVELSILNYKIVVHEANKIISPPYIYLISLKQIGTLYGYLPNKDSSFWYFNKALEVNKKYFHSKQDDADIYLQMSWIIGLESEKKLKAALKARELCLEIYGERSYRIAQVNKSISDIYSSNKDYQPALSYSLQNMRIYDSLPGINPEIIIQNDLNIIRDYRNISKLDSAEYFIDNSINKFKNSNCKDSLLLGQLFFERGNIKQHKMSYVESITSYKNAENVFFILNDLDYLSFVYSQMGYVYTQLANFDDAKKCYLKGLELDEKIFGVYSDEAAFDHGSLGLLYQNTGDYKNAKAEYLLEKKIYDILFPEKSIEQARIFQSLGMVEFGLQNWEIALNYYLKSLEVFKKLGLEKGVDCALLYKNISLYYNRIGDFKKSIYYTEMATEIYKQVYGVKSSRVASSYNSLGSLSLSLSQFSVSKNYYEKALSILINGKENIIDLAKTYEGFGNIYEKLSLLDSSEYYYLKALKIYLSVYPDGNNSVISTYDELAMLYWEKDDKKLALENKKKSLDLTKKIYGNESERAANSYMELPLYFSNIDSAISYLSRAEKILFKINPHHEDLGECYELIGENYFKKGDRSKAYDYQTKGLKISIDAYGEKSWQVASKYARIAALYQNANMYKPCIENFNKAIEIMAEVKGKNSEDVADLYGYISSTYQQFSDYETALKYLDKKSKILESIYDTTHIAWANLFTSYGGIYFEMGQYRKSLEYHRKGFSIAKNYYHNESPTLIGYLNDIATCYQGIGKSDTAIFILNQGLDLLRIIGYEYSFEGATLHNNIGKIYHDFNLEDAKKHYLKSVEIMRHMHKEFSAGSELCYGNLSSVCTDLYVVNNSKEDGLLSIAYCDTALMVANNAYPEGNIKLAPIYGIAGFNFESANLFKYADKYYKQALNIFIRTNDSLNRDVVITLYFLGRTKLHENKYDSAEIYFSKSLSLFHRMPKAESESLPSSLIFHNKALSEFMHKKYKEAGLTCSDAISARKEDWKKMIAMMSEADREEYVERIKWTINLQGNIALSDNMNNHEIVGNLFDNSIFQKGILLNSLRENNEKKSSIVDTLEIKIISQLKNENNKLSRLYQLSRDQRNENKTTIDSVEENIRELERKISHSMPSPIENISWKTIQQKIKSDESVVEILHFNKVSKIKIYKDSSLEIPSVIDSVFYAALILTSETIDHPKLVFLKNGNDLDSTYFKRYQQYLTNPKQREDKDWESYHHFWAAIDSVIGDKKIIYVSPDGVYNKINLETLVIPDGKYLSEKKDIRIIGSSRELLEQKEPVENPKKNALLVGNPNFNSSAADTSLLAFQNPANTDAFRYTTRSFENTNLTPLPASEKEVKSIAEVLKKYNYQITTLIGNTAQEGIVKTTRNPSILHIATHGFFEKDLEIKEREFSDFGRKRAVENPMLRSGLLLAGAEKTIKGNYDPKDGTENGILTAYEVQQMNLDSTELVVLSACETGLGEVKNGEGVYGLQRAFRIAGAKTIIMSLWKVDDEATQLLMTSFYENWLSGKTKREAFKSAQDILKKSPRYSHPYYWGAFVLIGE